MWIKYMPLGEFLWYHIDPISILEARNSLGKRERLYLFMTVKLPKLIKLESFVLFFFGLEIILVIHWEMKKLPNKSGSNNWINNCSKTHEFSVLYHSGHSLILKFKRSEFLLVFYMLETTKYKEISLSWIGHQLWEYLPIRKKKMWLESCHHWNGLKSCLFQC